MEPKAELETLSTGDLDIAAFAMTRGAHLLGVFPTGEPYRFQFKLDRVLPGHEEAFLNDEPLPARSLLSTLNSLRIALAVAKRKAVRK